MKGVVLFVYIFISTIVIAQPFRGVHWSADGSSYYETSAQGIIQYSLPDFTQKIIAATQQLIPKDSSKQLPVRNFFFSNDSKKILIYTNSKRVWRYDTRGDYWVLNTENSSLKKLGANLPSSSLMFAKFSPDGNNVAYVSMHNIYMEDLNSGAIKQLTTDGTDRMINGTFDWVYEEEFDCRDGFRWSPDSKKIAYWKIDATKIRNFLMIDYTDSIYSFNKPVEYPKVGESPSACYIYVVDVNSGSSKKMDVPGDPQQHYIPRMEWAANSNEIIIQQLNRKQNESNIMYCNSNSGDARSIYNETDKAWIDIKARWSSDPTGWEWVNNGKNFLWVSEKDGWRHIFLVSKDGKKETLITKGNYDIITIDKIDDETGYIYFIASPQNATQKYLYRIKMDGKSNLELLSPAAQKGTHDYDISPNGLYAQHSFSNASTPPAEEWISLPKHESIKKEENNAQSMPYKKVEFFTITTEDKITMDGWMVKPDNFDSTKKYPVLFYVYTEPAGQTVTDEYGTGQNFLYTGSMAKDGYIYMSVEGRGAPAPKGAPWRKSIYRQIGRINISDQAMAAKQIIQWPFVDTSRIAVWGWSGGAGATLNLLCQYPDIYKTGIAVAAVANQLTYDNIYQERYMGLPQENREDFVAGSPITYVKNLRGHLLYVHGTGDDNVHYQNAEMLLNELIKYNKQFQFMAYPNRSHSISEGAGTREHLATLYTNFLQQYCPPGGR